MAKKHRTLEGTRTRIVEDPDMVTPGQSRAFKFSVIVYAETVEDAAEAMGYSKTKKQWDDTAVDFDSCVEVSE